MENRVFDRLQPSYTSTAALTMLVDEICWNTEQLFQVLEYMTYLWHNIIYEAFDNISSWQNKCAVNYPHTLFPFQVIYFTHWNLFSKPTCETWTCLLWKISTAMQKKWKIAAWVTTAVFATKAMYSQIPFSLAPPVHIYASWYHIPKIVLKAFIY